MDCQYLPVCRFEKSTLWNNLLVEHVLLMGEVDFVSQVWVHLLLQLLF